MRGLNYLCENDISDDDCLRCGVHGIMFSCPVDCPDFRDVRKGMSPDMLAERDRLMKIMGVEDDPKWNKCKDAEYIDDWEKLANEDDE